MNPKNIRPKPREQIGIIAKVIFLVMEQVIYRSGEVRGRSTLLGFDVPCCHDTHIPSPLYKLPLCTCVGSDQARRSREPGWKQVRNEVAE